MQCDYLIEPSPPLAFTPVGLLLPNIELPGDNAGPKQREPQSHEEMQAPRPGGILIVAILSGLSGAIMGLIFGGYLTAALAVLVSVPIGIAVGAWGGGLKG